MKFEEIESKLKAYKSEGKTLFTTSSFQSHSLVLVHILEPHRSNHPRVLYQHRIPFS